MRIQNTVRTGAVKGTDKTRRSSQSAGTGFSTMVAETGETTTAAGLSGLQGVGGVDALFALEQMSADQKSQAAIARGEDLLDQLDQLRIHLLAGAVPESSLNELSEMAQQQRDSVNDPRLAELLDDIDLRAQVELAKLERDRRRA
ncbi:MAG: hypothetical protein Alpg2KO_07710 [Alphaproteobacteria bacterium]